MAWIHAKFMLGVTSRGGEWECNIENRGDINFIFRVFFKKYEANMIKMLTFISLSGRYIDVYYPLHYSVFLKFHN